MALNYNLVGNLVIQNKSPIKCSVQLNIEVIDYENEKIVDEKNFTDGVKLVGELSYLDTSPPTLPIKYGMGANNDVKLSLNNGNIKDGSIDFPIVIFDRTASVDHGKDRIYFWQFTICGKPTHDSLGIFPNNFSFTTKNRIFICRFCRSLTDCQEIFVIVAPNLFKARKMAQEKFNSINWTLEEINFDSPCILPIVEQTPLD